MLSDAVAWLASTLAASEGKSVVYSRKLNSGTQTTTLTAWVGRSQAFGITDAAATVQWGEQDYLIPVANLKINGVATTPQKGDRIADGAIIWELSSPQTEEACWHYSDTTRLVYRCHVKRVG